MVNTAESIIITVFNIITHAEGMLPEGPISHNINYNPDFGTVCLDIGAIYLDISV